MMFQRILPLNIEGATLFGLSLSTLHSATIDRNELRKWVDALADYLSFSDDEQEEVPRLSFHDQFQLELLFFCLHVAECDGPISDKIFDGANYLVGEAFDRDEAFDTLPRLKEAGWMDLYPQTFKLLVWNAASSEEGILVAGEIYYFYRQAARYIFSIEHDCDFEENSKACGYVEAFKKYVERVSVINFELPPEDRQSIDEVCREWDRLVEAERNELRSGICGIWRCVSGDALSENLLSDLSFLENGEAILLGDSQARKKNGIVCWSLTELHAINQLVPVVHLPDIKASVVMMPLDHDRMVATIYSMDVNLNLKTACYQRESTDAKSVAAADDQGSQIKNTSPMQADKRAEEDKPKRKGRKAAIIGVVLVAVLAGVLFAIDQSRPENVYRLATNNLLAGKYSEAASAFDGLGDYQNSNAMKQKALLGVEAQESERKAGSDSASWIAAAEAYERLGDDVGRSKAEYCRSQSVYYAGKQLMAEGKWVEARDALASISTNSSKDVSRLLDECNTHVLYDEASALFNEGRYYDAYVRFKRIADEKVTVAGLSDAGARASACAQEVPETGEIYINPDYSSSAVGLTINNSNSNSFIKIYDGDDLVRSLFIRPNDSASIGLPPGTYRMNEAHGSKWFDPEGAFGSEGNYFKCTFAGEEEFTLEWGYDYTITTSQGYRVGGTGMGSQKIDQDAF